MVNVQCEEPPKHIWLVQHNLAGLQRPYKLIYDDDYGGWYDESGDVGEDNYGNNLNFPKDITDYDTLTRYFFRTEAEANKCFEILDRYRTTLKARM